MTAPPQKLQLLLIDGALRFAGRARDRWHSPNDDQVNDCLERCQSIVAELVSAVRIPGDPDRPEEAACRMAANVYLFLYRTLAEVRLHRDRRKLDEVLRILEIERETWHTICEKLGVAEGANLEPEVSNHTRLVLEDETSDDHSVSGRSPETENADDGQGFSWRA